MTDTASTGATQLWDPLWNTVVALGDMVVMAQAGTALFAFVLVVLSLEFLRESKGFFVYVARVAVVGSFLFVTAYFIYGDFLAQPAKAAFERISAEAPSAAENTLLLTTLGAAGAGLTFYAGRKSGAASAIAATKNARTKQHHRSSSPTSVLASSRLSDPGLCRGQYLANRIQLRPLIHNPKKPHIRPLKPSAWAASSAPSRRLQRG